ncbi:glycosyltransferase [Streptomyces griseoviridis]|uniref:glycosyltransferase n=1 Tax=Streptomyces griseoviridis TaxID=45398 RepID=UPI00340497D3
MRGHRPERRIIHVSLGRSLGGLPELLRGEMAELARRGVTARWLSIDVPNRLGDASAALSDWLHDIEPAVPQDPAQVRAVMAEYGRGQAEGVLRVSRPGDTVVLHDPMPASLAPYLPRRRVVWRSHIGAHDAHGGVRQGALALDPFLTGVQAALFHRHDYAWPGLPAPVVAAPPGVNIRSVKHVDLPRSEERDTTLRTRGVLPVRCGIREALVQRPEVLLDDHGTGFLPSPDTPYVVQVSRWDPLKGQLEGLRLAVPVLADMPDHHYVLVGPHIRATLMGSTNARVLRSLLDLRGELPPDVARRVHVWTFLGPAGCDQWEAVNRLRTGARLVVCPSLREGFGLSVTEAMCRRATVLASPVGGHLDQIQDGANGWLARTTGAHWTARLASLLGAGPDPRLGRSARQSVLDHYTVERSVDRQLELFGLSP